METRSVFSKIREQLSNADCEAVLSFLAAHFRQQKQYSELFEVLKCKIRMNLGLPLNNDVDAESLSEADQRELEHNLLSACKEVGTLLVNDGQIAQGWMYLQPVADRQLTKQLFESVSVDDSNLDEMIDVALYQWAAPQIGYKLMLENQGTCNGITFFDTHAAYQNDKLKAELSEILIEHVYLELVANVDACISNQESAFQPEGSLANSIENRAWLFNDCGHHLDVTHLASIVRIARNCESRKNFQMAAEMCSYGMQIDPQLVYESEPPFENLYSDHLLYFAGLLENNFAESENHFVAKCDQLLNTEYEEVAVTVLSELYLRTGRSDAAIKLLCQRELSNTDISLLSLGNSKADFEQLMQHFESNRNLLGFAMSGIRKVLTV